MKHVLKLGFREKPTDLTEVLEGHGFRVHMRTFDSDRKVYVSLPQRIEAIDREVPRGLGIEYIGEVGEHERELLQVEPSLEVCAIFTAYTIPGDLRGGGYWFDTGKQWVVATALRDHYDAVLYDPQKNRVVRE